MSADRLTTVERARAGGPCLTCVAVSLLLAGAVVASFVGLGIDFGAMLSGDALRLMGKFIAEFLHPDLSAPFVAKTAWATLQTLAVSALGTLLAIVGGAVVALPASGRFGSAPRQLARLLLNFLRSVPELVWGALMVLAVGLGPFAGVLALALHTTGVLGRLYAETLENVPREPERALVGTGSGAVVAFVYGSLPLVVAQGVAYALYRWEMNIRMAAVLGFVGAGGLGQMLYFHLSIFQQAQAATVLLAMLALVFIVDILSSRLRRGLAPAYT